MLATAFVQPTPMGGTPDAPAAPGAVVKADVDRDLLELGGRVAVSARRAEEWVVIEVTDTGIGIPVEDQDKIFDRFFRSSAIADLAVTGTGLGLWITKTIVEEHGGQITVSSVPGVGTQFTVMLRTAAHATNGLRRGDGLLGMSTAERSSRFE